MAIMTSVFLIGIYSNTVGYVVAQSKYSPFYVNETAEAEKNRIEYETFSSPEYGFSIDYLKGADIEDKLDVEEVSKTYDVEGPGIVFRNGGPEHLGVRFSSFDIYLNDSINMERYIQRDLEKDPFMTPEHQTKVLNSGTPITIANLTGKVIKFIPMGFPMIKEAAYFNDGINTYHIEYTDDSLTFNDEVFNHIANSFKFIPVVKSVNNDNNLEQSDDGNSENGDNLDFRFDFDNDDNNNDDDDDDDNNDDDNN